MIIWIASYPKSGNTWIRSLLSSYLFSENGKFSFELLENIKQFTLKDLPKNLPKRTNYQDLVTKRWISNQQFINKDHKIHFLKTHNAICTINGNKFTDEFNTKAAIYVVRDPRNIISSLTHHYELSLNEAYDFLLNKRKIIFPVKDKEFNFLSDWAGHYNSWKNINFCSIKIVKYEDLINNTKDIFISILDFLSKFMNLRIDQDKILNAIDTTKFENLSKMEDKGTFNESAVSLKTNKKIKFFNLGKKNDWRLSLDKKMIKGIETNFKPEMLELKYL